MLGVVPETIGVIVALLHLRLVKLFNIVATLLFFFSSFIDDRTEIHNESLTTAYLFFNTL